MQGLILLNKPEGLTSFSAVSRVKRIVGEKRVGHTGTLDPMATGVLPILVGRATALSSLMLDADKKYIATIRLGLTTDTDDITGNILTQNAVSVSKKELETALQHFTGEIMQTPPMFSALKKDGVRLYKLARQGQMVEIQPRRITVLELKLLSELNEQNEFKVEAFVSKGTYIRSLARDIGEYLGCGATLSALERSFASGFSVEDCVTLEQLSENCEKYILNEEKAVEHLRQITVTNKQAVRFCNGGKLDFQRLKITEPLQNELLRVKLGETLLGIGVADCENQQVAIKCIINYPKGENE